MRTSQSLVNWSASALALAVVLVGCSAPARPGLPNSGGTGSETGGSSATAGTAGTANSQAGSSGRAGAGGDDGSGGNHNVTGTENCFNGVDDNNDTRVDCGDPMCTTACASSCPNAVDLPDPSSVFGLTTGHASQLDSSCKSSGAPSGPEVVYRMKIAKTGLLRAHLQSSTNLTVSVRTTCDSAASEKSCSLIYSTTPVTAAQTLYVIVDGYDATSSGPYTLDVGSGPTVCGDGYRDPTEDCDDRNTKAGDGCSPTCKVESTESASNDTPATADSYETTGYFGKISPAGDVDVVKIAVVTPGSSITASVNDFGDQACRLGLMDSMVEILAPDGTQVLASNDDRSPGDRCSAATADNVVAGTYYVRVSAGNGGAVPTFAYHLDIAVVTP